MSDEAKPVGRPKPVNNNTRRFNFELQQEQEVDEKTLMVTYIVFYMVGSLCFIIGSGLSLWSVLRK